MPVREGPPEPAPVHSQHKMRPVDRPEPYPAEKARGAEIVLRTPARRIIFFGGLIDIVVIVLALRILA